MNKIKPLLGDSETLMIFGIIIALTIISAAFVGRYLQRWVSKKALNQNADVTNFLFIKHVVKAII